MDESDARQPVNQLKKIESASGWALLFFITIIVAFCAASAVSDAGTVLLKPLLNSLSASLVTVAAGLLVGALLGFLFGIPKTLQRSATIGPAENGKPAAPNSEATRRAAFLTNTSFEEISDWLTKIIVGLGLVQFQKILQAVYWASLMLATLVTGKPIEEASIEKWWMVGAVGPVSYFYALIVASLLGGMLFMYLETRTRLALLFLGTQHELDKGPRELLAEGESDILTKPEKTSEPTGAGPAPRLAPVTAADRKIAEIPRADLKTPNELMQWAAAQARLEKYDVALEALQAALKLDDDSVDIRLRIADVLKLQKKDIPAIKMQIDAAENEGSRKKRGNILREAARSALYAAPPEGFALVKTALTKLLADQPKDALAHAWIAAAYGQEHRWLGTQTQLSTRDADMKRARDSALKEVKAAIAQSPRYDSYPREVLRAMLDPVKADWDPEENDLEDFKTDVEFVTEINRPDPEGRPPSAPS